MAGAERGTAHRSQPSLGRHPVASANVAFKTNEHVSRMMQHLPLGAGSSQQFDEYVAVDQSVRIPTRAYSYLRESVEKDEWSLLVLTGDAGHGKTSMCRFLLEDLGFSASEAKRLIQKECHGTTDIVEVGDGQLRILKDLSQEPPGAGGIAMIEAIERPGVRLVACANEGRLRDEIDHHRHGALDGVREALKASVEMGVVGLGDDIVILNLNYQAVASPDNSLVGHVLADWAGDDARWSACEDCDGRPFCPIFENHRLLSSKNALGEQRRSRVGELLRVAEMLSEGFTVRELLMVIAHALTAGLDCASVAENVGSQPASRAWQADFLFHQRLFGHGLEPELQDAIRPLAVIGMIDPGLTSMRPIDEQLLPAEQPDAGVDMESPGGRFLPPGAIEEVGVPFDRADAKAKEKSQREVVRFLRRSHFFSVDESSPAQLGLRSVEAFSKLLQSDLSGGQRRRIRDEVLAGLEAAQGLRLPTHAGLNVVEPAFASRSASAPVLACTVPVTAVELMSRRAWWERDGGGDVADCVDWLDRVVVACFTTNDGEEVTLELDLLAFEFLVRTARGMDAREFFQAQTRRMLGELAKLAGDSSGDETVLYTEEGIKRLILDEGLIRTVR